MKYYTNTNIQMGNFLIIEENRAISAGVSENEVTFSINHTGYGNIEDHTVDPTWTEVSREDILPHLTEIISRLSSI